MQIQSGDILAWRGSSALDRLIEHVSGGSYCHVGVAYVAGGTISVLQAIEGAGVNKVALADNLPCDHIPTGLAWTQAVEDFAVRQIGRRYSYLDALEVGIGIKPTDHRGLICSTYARDVLIHAGLKLPLTGMTPSALVDDLLDLGADLRLVRAL